MSDRSRPLSDATLDQVTGGGFKPGWDRSKPGAPSNHETEREKAVRELKELLNTPV